MNGKSATELKRMEQKVNLLNDKVDRIMEVQGIALIKGQYLIQKEEERKRKARERQQQRMLDNGRSQQQLKQHMEDWRLVKGEGGIMMHQFNLFQPPPAARIREYQRTKNSKAFDGLKRIEPGKRRFPF